MISVRRVGGFALKWGESACWDDRTRRLYAVDCLGPGIHWLQPEDGELQTLAMPSMPTGLVLREAGGVAVILQDGVFGIDPDCGTVERLAGPPPDEPFRLNDACADREGNLITGSVCPDDARGGGRCWRLAPDGRWDLLFSGISNANGPAVSEAGTLLFVADTPAHRILRAPYESASGRELAPEIWADTRPLDGVPDGAALDEDGGLWSAIFGGGRLARFEPSGRLLQTIELPVPHPTSVAFGGPALDRLYVTCLGVPYKDRAPRPEDAGGIFEIRGASVRGLAEGRFLG